MDTERYCKTLDKLDKEQAIRAIHEAYLQMSAMGKRVEINGIEFNNKPTIEKLKDLLIKAGHIGFTD